VVRPQDEVRAVFARLRKRPAELRKVQDFTRHDLANENAREMIRDLEGWDVA
jgi:hypothetical protein